VRRLSLRVRQGRKRTHRLEYEEVSLKGFVSLFVICGCMFLLAENRHPAKSVSARKERNTYIVSKLTPTGLAPTGNPEPNHPPVGVELAREGLLSAPEKVAECPGLFTP
jgi:hypothetical protein